MVSDNLPSVIPQPRKPAPIWRSSGGWKYWGNQHFLLTPDCRTFTLNHLRSFDEEKSYKAFCVICWRGRKDAQLVSAARTRIGGRVGDPASPLQMPGVPSGVLGDAGTVFAFLPHVSGEKEHEPGGEITNNGRICWCLALRAQRLLPFPEQIR